MDGQGGGKRLFGQKEAELPCYTAKNGRRELLGLFSPSQKITRSLFTGRP